MRFSFKKALASVLSAALVLSTFVGALTTSAADVAVAGTLTMDDVTVVANDANEFDVVANIALDEASEYVEVAFTLALPEGVALGKVSVGELGTAVIDAETGAILVSVVGPVTEIPVTITLVAAKTAAVAPFTLAVNKIAYADVTEADETIDVTDTAVITVTNHAPKADYTYDGTYHWYPCQVEGCDEQFGYGYHKHKTEVIVEPTCTTGGRSRHTCTVCGRAWEANDVPATNEHTYEYVNNGDNHIKTCTSGKESVVEDHEFVDGVCICTAEEVTECTHDYVGKETVAATCKEPGVMTYTCSTCGESYTEVIPATGEHTYGKVYMNKETYEWVQTCACGETKAAAENELSATLVSNSLILEAAVGDKIGVNRATSSGLVNKYGYADYYIEVAYEAYGQGYVIENKIKKFTSSDFFSQNAKKTVDYFKFTEVALYEMAKDFTINLYLLDAEGDVVAVNKSTTSIQALAISYAASYGSDAKLIKTLADMMEYGAAVQNYFAGLNPGTAIDGAELPTEGCNFLDKASVADELPESYNTTKVSTKLVSTTKMQIGTPSVVIGASNTIKYQIKANKTDGYEAENMKVVASYVDAYGRTITDEVNFSELAVSDGKNTVYTYIFKDLAIYDLDKTITVTVYNDGVAQYQSEYSVGNFISSSISTAALTDILTRMQLFSQSANAKLVG